MTRLQLLLACSLPLAVFACSESSVFSSAGDDDDAVGAGSPGQGSNGNHGGTATPPTAAPGESAGPPSDDGTPLPPSATLPAVDASTPPQAGILTAGAWDDNANFARWEPLRTSPGALASALPISLAEQVEASALWNAAQGERQTIDVSLVIDTTGSMGDELGYVTRELESIAQRIQRSYPRASPRWSLVVYRDRGDAYVERHVDFETDVAAFRQRLGAQTAGGGGDFPEAPDAALAAMNALAWRANASAAKVAFWIADAPPHEENLEAMADAIRGAKERGVHVYPIASSGIDEHTEYVMRATAQLTGGRYLFLTDDSGVGESHLEPKVPCFYVTKLDDAILRVVDHELTGTHRLPMASETVRTSGQPVEGRCQSADAGLTTAY